MCIKFARLPVVLMQRFWHHLSSMQNDPKGVGRPASAVRSSPENTTEPHAAAGSPEGSPIMEIGGPKGPEPTRFGDWEKNGRCIDF